MNMINDLAAAFYPIPDSGDPFWQQSARSLFIGAVHALMLLKKENPEIPVNLASAHQLIAGGEQRLGGISCLRELIQTLRRFSKRKTNWFSPLRAVGRSGFSA